MVHKTFPEFYDSEMTELHVYRGNFDFGTIDLELPDMPWKIVEKPIWNGVGIISIFWAQIFHFWVQNFHFISAKLHVPCEEFAFSEHKLLFFEHGNSRCGSDIIVLSVLPDLQYIWLLTHRLYKNKMIRIYADAKILWFWHVQWLTLIVRCFPIVPHLRFTKLLSICAVWRTFKYSCMWYILSILFYHRFYSFKFMYMYLREHSAVCNVQYA